MRPNAQPQARIPERWTHRRSRFTRTGPDRQPSHGPDIAAGISLTKSSGQHSSVNSHSVPRFGPWASVPLSLRDRYFFCAIPVFSGRNEYYPRLKVSPLLVVPGKTRCTMQNLPGAFAIAPPPRPPACTASPGLPSPRTRSSKSKSLWKCWSAITTPANACMSNPWPPCAPIGRSSSSTTPGISPASPRNNSKANWPNGWPRMRSKL